MHNLLRVFSALFYSLGTLFWIMLGVNVMNHRGAASEWYATWFSWFAQGVACLFLAYVATWMNNMEARLREYLGNK